MKEINEEMLEYLYDELDAKYLKIPNDVELNLDNDENKNLIYLGTYFPRSFTESYNIYKNLFDNEKIYNRFNKKKIIRILDIGSGTGGSLFGLLQVLMEKFSGKTFEIISIEGNKNACELQLKLLKSFKKFVPLKNRFKASVYNMRFKDKDEVEIKLSKLGLNSRIDIMQSFKVVNEFYRKDYKNNKGMYSHLLFLGDKWLKKSGVLCIVDVTNKINNGQYASIIFNEEVKKFLGKVKADLVYILPRCCAVNYKQCSKGEYCFSKREFRIVLKNGNTDTSKINYKVFIKNKLGSDILNEVKRDLCEWYDDEMFTCYCRDLSDDYNCTKFKEEPYLL